MIVINKSTVREYEDGFILENVFTINGTKYKKSQYFTEQELKKI